MKKIIAMIFIVSFTFVLAGCGKVDEKEKDYSVFTYLPTLNYATFEEKVKSGETFFVYIGHINCGDSKLFNEQFESLFVDETDVLMVDFENFYYFEISEIVESLSDRETRTSYKDLYGFYSTPSLVAYQDTDEDGVSDVLNMAEWQANEGFYMRDYMQWFYDNDLLIAKDNVVHEGPSKR